MQAILVTIMRRYYAVQRDIVLGATIENNANWSVEGAENATVAKLEDRMAIHKSLYDGIALAESKYGPGRTFIPLDIVLGLRDPDAADANQHVILVKLFGEALAADRDKRLAFFRSKIAKNFPTALALFESLLGVAQGLGLDLSFFGPGNKLAGLTFVERPGAGPIDLIDAHISIEPSYYHQGASTKRVSGYHFTNHHAPTGGAGGSAQTLHQFYTNYGKPMSVERAIEEAARVNRPPPINTAIKTPPRAAQTGRFGLLASGSGASEESPHRSPYHGEVVSMKPLSPKAPVPSFRFEIRHHLEDKPYIITWFHDGKITYELKKKTAGKIAAKELPRTIISVKDTITWSYFIKDMLDALNILVKTDPTVQRYIDDLEIMNLMVKAILMDDDLGKLYEQNNNLVKQINALDAQLDALQAQVDKDREEFKLTAKKDKALRIMEQSIGRQLSLVMETDKREKMFESHKTIKQKIAILDSQITAIHLTLERKKREHLDKYLSKISLENLLAGLNSNDSEEQFEGNIPGSEEQIQIANNIPGAEQVINPAAQRLKPPTHNNNESKGGGRRRSGKKIRLKSRFSTRRV